MRPAVGASPETGHLASPTLGAGATLADVARPPSRLVPIDWSARSGPGKPGRDSGHSSPICDDAWRVSPGTVHRFRAVTDCLLFEVSTPELEDVVRIEDDFGREGTSDA